jgi:hypothetical protein
MLPALSIATISVINDIHVLPLPKDSPVIRCLEWTRKLTCVNDEGGAKELDSLGY